MRDRRTFEEMKVFEQCLKKSFVFFRRHPLHKLFLCFSYQRSRVDRPGESDPNEKLVDEETEKLKVTQNWLQSVYQ